MKISLIYPKGLLELTPEEKALICNGAGSSQYPDFVPDTMYGMNMNESADIHDYCYYVGMTRIDKIISDCLYLYNMFADINNRSSWLLSFPRKSRALLYVEAVNAFGDSCFFEDKKHNKVNCDDRDFLQFIDDAEKWLFIIKKFVLFCGKKSIKFKLLNKAYTKDDIGTKFTEIILCIIKEFEIENKTKVSIENGIYGESFFKEENND